MLQPTVHDIETFFVDFQVLVVLQVVDSNHTASLFNVLCILVHATGTCRILINLSNLEDVLKTVKGNLNYFVVHRSKKVTHGLDATLRDEISDLIRFLETTGGGIGDGPTCFLLGLEISIGEDVDEGRDNVTGITWLGTIIASRNRYHYYSRIDDGLDLHGGTRSDVGDCPTSLFPDAFLGRR